jgi:hypothetical protein
LHLSDDIGVFVAEAGLEEDDAVGWREKFVRDRIVVGGGAFG